MDYKVIKDRTITHLQELFKFLEVLSDDKKSTNDITPERLLWEMYNKFFTILVSCENSLRFKDSLSVHLVARYTYEILIIFLYVFLDEKSRQERAAAFLSFNQFQDFERSWLKGKTYADLLKDIPDNWSDFHKDHYRTLSNFSHPTMDSFLLNRRGEEAEFKMIINTSLLVARAIEQVAEVCLYNDLYFDPKRKEEFQGGLMEQVRTTTILMAQCVGKEEVAKKIYPESF